MTLAVVTIGLRPFAKSFDICKTLIPPMSDFFISPFLLDLSGSGIFSLFSDPSSTLLHAVLVHQVPSPTPFSGYFSCE